jgi:hypothetical protein
LDSKAKTDFRIHHLRHVGIGSEEQLLLGHTGREREICEQMEFLRVRMFSLLKRENVIIKETEQFSGLSGMNWPLDCVILFGDLLNRSS